MSDTAVSTPKNSAWANLSDEERAARVAKMRSGKKKAKKAGEPVVEAHSTALVAEAPVTAPPSPRKNRQCVYECMLPETDPTGRVRPKLTKATSLDDPAWLEISKVKINTYGSFYVQDVIRDADGFVIDTKVLTHYACEPHQARASMEMFQSTNGEKWSIW